jgi:hypothetical protein
MDIRCDAQDMTTTSQPQQYADVVDLRRYPINEPDGQACRDLVRDCQDQLRDRGVAQLPGFLTPGRGPPDDRGGGPAGRPGLGERPEPHRLLRAARRSAGADHPRALLQHSAKKAIAYDLIPDAAPIRRLYESADLTAFIAGAGQAGALPQRRPAGRPGNRDLRRRRRARLALRQQRVLRTVMYPEVRGGRSLRLLTPGCATSATRTTPVSGRSCWATRAEWSGCPAARARSRSSAASTPCTGSHRSAARGRGSTRC